MAPPRKRRRLSQSLPLMPEMALFEPIPPFTHAVSDLQYKADSAPVPTVPERIEEIHWHTQERSLDVESDEDAVLERRQTAYPITTIDAQGNSIVSTITVGLHAGAATSVVPTPTTTTTPATSTDTDPWGPEPSSNQRSTGSNRGRTSATVTVAAVSTNAGGPGSGSALRSTYVATLTNSNVRTITRSARPYATTFGDGEVSTICGRNGQCRLSPSPSAQPTTRMLGSAGNSQSSSAAAGGTASSASQNQSDGDGNSHVATIAGSVVGGLVAIALLLILALVWLRWLKRRRQQGHQELGRSSSPNPELDHLSSEAPPDMAENARLTPVVGAAPLIFQQENKSVENSGSGEQGFARVSGRKLPSAFSDGAAQRDMAVPPPVMPLAGEQDLRGRSFQGDTTAFRDDDDTQNEMSVSPEPSQTSDHAPTAMTLSAGPERRPTIHEPGPYLIEPSTSSTNTPAREVRDSRALSPDSMERSGTPTLWRSETPTLGRSDTPSTIADNRSSRFTEGF